MAIHVALRHLTEYKYDRSVSMSPHWIRLRPAPHCRTPILSYSLKVLPEKHFVSWQQDPQSNWQARYVFPEKSDLLRVEVELIVEMAVFNPFDFFLEETAEKFPFEYDVNLAIELVPYRYVRTPTPLLKKLIDSIPSGPHPTVDFLVSLNQRIQKEVSYVIRMEPGVQTPEETLTLGKGSCRDSAWLLVNLLRHLGFAARFVSGYLIQLTPDVKALDGPSGASTDFTDLHAWTEVYLPGAGWIGFDPTSGLMAGEGHIPLACAPWPSNAAPVVGAVDKCETEFKVEMSVTRLYETPRVTKPYTVEQWEKIYQLGKEIDAELVAGDVRLTMGGEPTFVSIDDFEGAEWNTQALGEKKRELAGALLKRLKNAYAPGGFLHHGQGKWYPGESLPRWALGCYWRKDGQPVWMDDDLIADESKNYGFGPDDARRFASVLCDRLGVASKHIIDAYEDTWYYLWKERRLPTNVDPFDSKLKDPEERARLARIFEAGLDKPSGVVLPIKRDEGLRGPYWVSGPWFLRPERMYLIPGDSPIGFRLPLESIPWVKSTDYPYVNEIDPMDPRVNEPLPLKERGQRYREAVGRLDKRTGFSHQKMAPERKKSKRDDRPPKSGESASWLIRTALCVEPRDGKLYVFMPPLRHVEDYLELVSDLEQTADELSMPILIEGYAPPSDPRVNSFKVTPDPGVIEVNLHPSESWDELVKKTKVLYDEARITRLGAEKFMLDGRHVGTGGGNHVILGGARTSDSPLLRRPDLLSSLIRYWHNHPSLSYLFSGLFIGPTSQAPRVDEARADSVYELEVALRELERNAGGPLWTVDRALRHLLIDVTGNTHRAEFCIDKLFSPDSATGRLGLLELRGFEMPPHADMSLTQQLLLRSLVSKFWKEPYKQNLARWGNQLHDRWMLPHFIKEDIHEVTDDLQNSGISFDPAWLDPHFEFRFPTSGELNVKGVRVQLRQALEPWLVLGEEASSGGAVRFVDSSVERMEVKVSGWIDARYQMACNGIALPLHPTGVEGEYVAGVRYRAWQPPSCLHPTISVHAPLTLDLVDLWNRKSVGGCQYHVMHPGGRNYAQFPINAYEAESRRLSRFFKAGHTQGKIDPKKHLHNPEFPMTLDLRLV